MFFCTITFFTEGLRPGAKYKAKISLHNDSSTRGLGESIPSWLYILSWHFCSLNSFIRSVLSSLSVQFRISFHWPCYTIGPCMIFSLWQVVRPHKFQLFFPFKNLPAKNKFSYFFLMQANQQRKWASGQWRAVCTTPQLTLSAPST